MFENTTFSFLFKRMDSMPTLKKGLDAYSTRQKVISANIANAETPGYTAKRVSFEDKLREILTGDGSGVARTAQSHLPHGRALRELEKLHPEIVEDMTEPFYNGVNNVDIEEEMTLLASNSLQYEAAAKVMSTRYRMLQGAIKGRM